MKRRRGQGLVEFALILPVLLFILLGIIEAAFVIQGYLTVQHAAREAARFAVTYQPIQGACLNDVPAAYPFCPRDDSESDEEYHARRVELIKGEARRAAAGLRINNEYLGNTRDRFEANWQEPGFFGIAVWGYPSFEIDCNAYDPWAEDNPCFDHPGLEGLPVRVLVEHNVELVDPLYRPIAEAIIDGPYVPVRADTQMLNEGIQVDFSDRVPPDFEKNPGFGEPPLPTVPNELTTPTPTNTPTQTVTPTPTLTSTTYLVWLSGDATNELPDDRSHEFIATVTDAQGQPVQGVQLRVSFSTDEGGFSYSGGGPKYDEQLTDELGQASVTLFGNGPGTATIRAWLDYDSDDSWDDREPSDTATKTWDVSGPYITVSDHEVIPQQYIAVDVMDHDPAGNPYRLLWCVVSGADITRTVTNELYVDGGGDAAGLGLGIPAGSQGLYRLETHSGSGDCGSTDLVAHSADIRVLAPPSNSVSISGEVRVLVSGIPVTFQGVDVWAYGLGEVYHTVTAPDGTYEFYSIPRGIYTIYAETWIGSWLRFASTTEAVYNDRDDVNLLLL
jgi:hypothetical protein